MALNGSRRWPPSAVFLLLANTAPLIGISLQQLMAQPYGRVVVLHLAVLGSGFLILSLGSPVAALVILIVLKTGLDLRAHLAERRKLAGIAEAAAPA